MHTIQAYQRGYVYAYDLGSQRETYSGTHGRHIRQDQDRCHPSGGIGIDPEKKARQLKSLSGKIHLDLDWKKLEQTELLHQASLKRRQHGYR